MKLTIFILFFFTAIACVQKAPQLPANKATASDSTSLVIQYANEKLIQGEDSILKDYVSKNNLKYQRDSSGLWLKFEKQSEGKLLKDSESCKIGYRIFSLDKRLLYEKTETIIIGKKQVISGIEIALRQMHPNDEVALIVPWYLGFGLKGNNAEIPPYTSLLVELSMFK